MRLAGLLLLLTACSGEPARLVSLALPSDTSDTEGPYVVEAQLAGDLDDADVLVCWSIDGTHFVAAPAHARAGRDDLRAAELPGQPAGATVSLAVTLACECPASMSYSFHVLGGSSGCVVDSDCRAGAEICVGGACQAFDGTCANGACPGGYVCDANATPPTCVVATP